MNQPAQAAAADAPARPDAPDHEADFWGTNEFFSRPRFFSDQLPTENKENDE